jgi:hypothetical protein
MLLLQEYVDNNAIRKYPVALTYSHNVQHQTRRDCLAISSGPKPIRWPSHQSFRIYIKTGQCQEVTHSNTRFCIHIKIFQPVLSHDMIEWSVQLSANTIKTLFPAELKRSPQVEMTALKVKLAFISSFYATFVNSHRTESSKSEQKYDIIFGT